MTETHPSETMEAGPEVYPVLPLRDIVVFPYMIVPLFVGREKSVRALEEVMADDKQILLASQVDAGVDDPSVEGIYTTGVLANVLQLLKLPDGTVKVLVEGRKRVEITEYTREDEYFEARAIELVEEVGDPAAVPAADSVVMETTYGDRLHKQLQPSIQELYDVINHTIGHGGNVVIPTFALERAQEILYYLREGVDNGKIMHFVTVFLDSPMAISATEIFRRHPECYDEEALELLRNHEDPFDLPGLHFTRETAESMAINEVSGAVIMAGSGMCTGGRVRHHLKHNLWNKHSSVVFVGYAAEGTLARRIVDGAEYVRIFGKEIPVHAGVHTISGFSAHADQAELLAWQRQTGHPETTFLVHGEDHGMHAFASKLENTEVEMPELHQVFTLQ